MLFWILAVGLILLAAYHLLIFWYDQPISPFQITLNKQLDFISAVRGRDGLELDVELLDWCRSEKHDSTSWRECCNTIAALLRLEAAKDAYRRVSVAQELVKQAYAQYSEHIFTLQGKDGKLEEERLSKLGKMLDVVFYKIYDEDVKRIKVEGITTASELIDVKRF